MGYQKQTTFEFFEVIFQNLQAHQIQIVGRFVHDEKIRLGDQNQQKLQPSLFTAAQFVHLVVLLFGWKQKALQVIAGGYFFAR